MNPDKDKKITYFAMALTALAFAYFFCITFLPIPASGARYADLILGF